MNYKWLDDYMLSKKGVIKEYKVEWEAYRYMLGDKMIGLLGMDSKERDIITVKCSPEFGAMLRGSFEDIRPGYHMNKVHWNSVDLKGNTPDEILKQMIDNSYDLILAALPKKVKEEILSLSD